MKRIHCLAWSVLLTAVFTGTALATPLPNGASIEIRTFNDCPLSIVTVLNNYPTAIEITDDMHPACLGFANLHSWTFSEDGGFTAAPFPNNSSFRFGADVTISGAGEGEGGLRISPWWSPFVDGRFMANATTGEIACFGGRLPFYSFTADHGLTYVRGTTIRMEVIYRANGLSETDPGTIQYRVVSDGMTYASPVLAFDMGNPMEDPPYGLWGILNETRVGGYFQPRANTAAALTANWSDVTFEPLGTPTVDGVSIQPRIFNDCPLSTVSVAYFYPDWIEIVDAMHPACLGFANLHSWSFSEDGGATTAFFNNNSSFHFGADFKISGDGEGEGGMRLSPWWSPFVDGRFMANATTGEIACFGGRLPFYSFTADHGLTYVRGTTIRMEITYRANGLSETDPGTIQYRVVADGMAYASPVLAFDMGNPGEDPPYGLWGILNQARAGGYFQPRANTAAELRAHWSNITFVDLEACPVAMEFSFHPRTLNVNSHARWVTGYLEPPMGYSAADIDVGSILLNGSVPVAAGSPSSIGDVDEDGIPDLMVKFGRADVGMLLDAGSDVSLTVTGFVAGDCFVGMDAIRVKGAIMPAPAAGVAVSSGQTVELAWTPHPDYSNVDLLASFDDGATWNVEALGLPDNGQYLWQVPDVMTDEARVAVVVITAVGPRDIVREAELGESETFAITRTVDVGDPQAMTFALRGIHPNPAVGGLHVTFSLPNAEPATLALFDVLGRRVAEQQVGGLGAGLHKVTLRTQGLKAGIYMVRLTRAGRTLTARAVVVE